MVVGQATSSIQYVRNNEKARFGSLYVDGKGVGDLAETFFNVGGKRYSSVDKSLKLINTTVTDGNYIIKSQHFNFQDNYGNNQFMLSSTIVGANKL